MVETKPFGISKRAVWEAYHRVRKNDGAAGVDGLISGPHSFPYCGTLTVTWCSGSNGNTPAE
jgi:hypothetical protein